MPYQTKVVHMTGKLLTSHILHSSEKSANCDLSLILDLEKSNKDWQGLDTHVIMQNKRKIQHIHIKWSTITRQVVHTNSFHLNYNSEF